MSKVCLKVKYTEKRKFQLYSLIKSVVFSRPVIGSKIHRKEVYSVLHTENGRNGSTTGGIINGECNQFVLCKIWMSRKMALKTNRAREKGRSILGWREWGATGKGNVDRVIFYQTRAVRRLTKAPDPVELPLTIYRDSSHQALFHRSL